MAKQQQTGKLGEDLACLFLQNIGYDIIARNWRFSKAEIDIIAKDKKVLVFVEVKARSYTFYGAPEESITAHKENLIIDAASQYMIQTNYDWEISFDIISIVFDTSFHPTINHYKDAFYPSI